MKKKITKDYKNPHSKNLTSNANPSPNSQNHWGNFWKQKGKQ
jgi:hypothetical protein